MALTVCLLAYHRSGLLLTSRPQYIPSTGKGEPIRREFWTQLRDERIPRMLEYHERFLVKEGTPFYLGKSVSCHGSASLSFRH